ncbi:MAG TPA: flippase [Gammaproteobacteria bacterium]|nr:flippase [Gammaproteobacteria bacterium]
MSDKQVNLTGGRRLTRNVVWNLLGTGTPLLVAIVAIPLLIEGLGTARFGVLTLAWMVVGYFSLFDLGLGRALTKLVAEKIGSGKDEEIPGVVWTAMTLMGALGVLGAIVITSLSPWLVGVALEIPEELQLETLSAFYLLAVSIPIVISSTGLRGILEAHQRFGVVNIIRLPLGMFTFLGPLAVLPFSNSLSDMVLVLICARIISWLAYLIVCLRLYPELRKRVKLGREMSKRLLSFGGWMTVSNITAPLLLYLGRVLIIVMISAEAVAYFVTPYEVVTKLLIIPGVLVSVLFPAFTHLFQKKTSSDVAVLYKKAMIYIFMGMLPLVLFVYFFAKDGLALWINEEFALNGYRVAQFLVIGVFINSFGHMSQALIQGYGRPDITAKLHLGELVIYIPYLWLLIDLHGIDGAAIAWTVRVAISTLVLSYLAHRCICGSLPVKY